MLELKDIFTKRELVALVVIHARLSATTPCEPDEALKYADEFLKRSGEGKP